MEKGVKQEWCNEIFIQKSKLKNIKSEKVIGGASLTVGSLY